MDLSKVLQDIKKTFVIRKKIDFDDLDFHFEVEPLSAADEAMVIESIKTLDGAGYIMALKRQSLALAIKKVNGRELGNVDSIDYLDEEGKAKSKSKYLYLLDYINEWPMSLVDRIFEVLNNLHIETEERVKASSKFEKFVPKIVEDQPNKDVSVTKLVEVPKEEDELSEVDKLNKKVAEELEEAQREISANS